MIDKFYRVYNPYNRPEPRSSKPNISLDDGAWDALNNKITNVKDGHSDGDVSTIGQTLTRKGNGFVQGKDKYEFLECHDNWDAKKRKITNVGMATDPDDCVVRGQTLALSLEHDVFYGKQKRIVGVLPGVNPNEVAVVDQVLTKGEGSEIKQGDKVYNVMFLTEDVWDAKQKPVKNLLPGKDVNDAVNYSQIPKSNSDEWWFANKRLVNVKDAYLDNDCVVKRQTITLSDGKFDAKGKQIANILPGTQAGDAAVVGQLMWYDGKQFRYKDTKFDLMDKKNYSKLLIANSKSPSGISTLDGKDYLETIWFNTNTKKIMFGNGELVSKKTQQTGQKTEQETGLYMDDDGKIVAIVDGKHYKYQGPYDLIEEPK